MADAKVAQVGLTIEITVKDENDAVYDISSATTKNVLLRRPDGTLVTLTGSFTTDGTDGKVQADTDANTFNTAGAYRVAAHIITASDDFETDATTLKVVSKV